MIFDKNYDKALWLLVAGNKKDSENICKLINYKPEEVYIKIQKAIDNYYNGRLNDVKENVIFSETVSNDDDYGCSVIVKIILGKLYINIYRWKEDIERLEEEYELVLKDIDRSNIDDMLYFDKKFVGKYSSEVNNIRFVRYLTDVNTVSYDRKFSLKKIPLGYIVSSQLRRRKIGMKYININKNMPEEIFVDDFSSQERIEGLVKKRKRVKNR